MAKIRRFYIDKNLEKEKSLKLPEKLRNYLINVLKLKNNSSIKLFGPDGREFIATLIVNKKEVYALPIEEISKSEENNLNIILCQALPKLNKMDFIVQKLTEVGIQKIITFSSSRVVFKGTNLESRLLRWQRIAEESARQCGRTDIPVIENYEKLEKVFNSNYVSMLKIILTPHSHKELKSLLRGGIKINKKGIVIVVGPEGGFEPQEIELAKNSGFIPVKLWKNILRTETAGVIVAGIVRYEWG